MLLGHVWDFIVVVVYNWVALVGGIVGMGIGFYERYKKRRFIGWRFRAVLGIALFVAAFLAWRDERLKIESLHLDRTTQTPTQLTQIYSGRTTTQGATLAAIYIGKWMEVSGQITDIQAFQTRWFLLPTISYYMSILDDNPDNTDWMLPKVSGTFDPKWSETLSVLKPKERITILGKISEVREHGVDLIDCRITALPHETAYKPFPIVPDWWKPDESPTATPSPTPAS